MNDERKLEWTIVANCDITDRTGTKTGTLLTAVNCNVLVIWGANENEAFPISCRPCQAPSDKGRNEAMARINDPLKHELTLLVLKRLKEALEPPEDIVADTIFPRLRRLE